MMVSFCLLLICFLIVPGHMATSFFEPTHIASPFKRRKLFFYFPTNQYSHKDPSSIKKYLERILTVPISRPIRWLLMRWDHDWSSLGWGWSSVIDNSQMKPYDDSSRKGRTFQKKRNCYNQKKRKRGAITIYYHT